MTRRMFGASIGTGLVATLAMAQVGDEKPVSSEDVTAKEISPDLITPEVKRVGDRLRCLCGCAMTVGECNMVGCHYASPARTRINEMLKAGMTDDQIVDVFVKEEGIKVLAAPPAKGFNWFGYSAPYILGGMGAGFVGLFIKRMMKKPDPGGPTGTGGAAITTDPATLSKYEAEAAKDIADLED